MTSIFNCLFWGFLELFLVKYCGNTTSRLIDRDCCNFKTNHSVAFTNQHSLNQLRLPLKYPSLPLLPYHSMGKPQLCFSCPLHFLHRVPLPIAGLPSIKCNQCCKDCTHRPLPFVCPHLAHSAFPAPCSLQVIFV